MILNAVHANCAAEQVDLCLIGVLLLLYMKLSDRGC